MKFVMTSISSRSEGTSSRSTSENSRGHFLGDLAPHAISLYKIDRREESRLPEQVRPRVGNLRLQLAKAAAQREFLKRRRTFREQNQIQANHTANRESKLRPAQSRLSSRSPAQPDPPPSPDAPSSRQGSSRRATL